MQKAYPYIIIALIAVIIYQWITIPKPVEIEKTTTVVDTFFVPIDTQKVASEPDNNSLVNPEVKIVHDTVEGKTDTLYAIEYRLKQGTFYSTDTLTYDSLKVAIVDTGNCSGIINRTATWHGKRRIIERTITNNIATPPQTFSLLAGVSNQITGKSITDIQPNAMILYKEKVGIEYGYGVMNQSHNIGVKIRLSKK